MVTDAREPVRNYPVPAVGNTIAEDFARLALALTAIGVDVSALLEAVEGKAALGHKHELADVVGLVTALANKAAADHAHALGGLSDVDTAGAAVFQVLAKALDGKWRPWTIDLANVIGAAAYARLDGATFTGATKVPTASTTADTTNAVNVTMLRAAIAALVASSPSTLDTLNELAIALGNDPNFATTMATALGTKANKATKLKVGSGLSLDGVGGTDAAPAESDLSTDRLIKLLFATPQEAAGGVITGKPVDPAGLAAAVAAVGKGGLKNVRLFTASGNVQPSTGASKWLGFLVGGGQTSQSMMAAGAGGAGCLFICAVSDASSYALTVGGVGGNSSLTIGATTYTANGSGGAAANGILNLTGQPGGYGSYGQTNDGVASFGLGPAGGDGPFGLGHGGQALMMQGYTYGNGNGWNGNPGIGYGAGGGSPTNVKGGTAGAQGAGTPGCLLLLEF